MSSRTCIKRKQLIKNYFINSTFYLRPIPKFASSHFHPMNFLVAPNNPMSERISRAPLIYEIDTRNVVGVASFSTGKSTMLSSLYNGQSVRSISLGLPSCPFSSFLAHADSILPQLKSGRARNFLFFRTARHEFHRVRWFPSLSSGRVFSPLEMHCPSPYRRPRFRKRNGILLCLAPEYRFPRWDTVGSLFPTRDACFFLNPLLEFSIDAPPVIYAN